MALSKNTKTLIIVLLIFLIPLLGLGCYTFYRIAEGVKHDVDEYKQTTIIHALYSYSSDSKDYDLESFKSDDVESIMNKLKNVILYKDKKFGPYLDRDFNYHPSTKAKGWSIIYNKATQDFEVHLNLDGDIFTKK